MNKFKSKTNISDYVIPMKVKWDQSFLYLKVSTFKWTKSNRKWMFPVDTPLVLRLVKTHMGKCLFSPELKSYLITQWNCTTIGSCSGRKTNQWVGSGAARTYGDDTRRNGRGIWLYKRTFRHRILRLFLLQRRRLRLHREASPRSVSLFWQSAFWNGLSSTCARWGQHTCRAVWTKEQICYLGAISPQRSGCSIRRGFRRSGRPLARQK